MNASEITFGIEIETTIPHGILSVGPHGRGYEIPSMPGWKADADPSIRARGGQQACEFVSPIFRGAEGLKQLVADIAKIKAMGAKVNASCGLHIHVGFDRANVEASKRLASLVSNFEKAIYASTGTRNRERGGWCRGLNRYGSADQAMQAAPRCRYHVLNLASHHPTVEFRAFSASLNPKKIIGYVRMCVGLVERALKVKRVTNWTAKPVKDSSPIHRSGEASNNINNHPHPADGGWIVHNGVIGNYHELVRDQDLPIVSQCDSEVLGLMLEQGNGSLIHRCGGAIAQADGGLAMMGLWARPAQLIVARRGNPLHLSDVTSGVYFASLADGLPGKPAAIRDDTIRVYTRPGGEIHHRIVDLDEARPGPRWDDDQDEPDLFESKRAPKAKPAPAAKSKPVRIAVSGSTKPDPFQQLMDRGGRPTAPRSASGSRWLNSSGRLCGE